MKVQTLNCTPLMISRLLRESFVPFLLNLRLAVVIVIGYRLKRSRSDPFRPVDRDGTACTLTTAIRANIRTLLNIMIAAKHLLNPTSLFSGWLLYIHEDEVDNSV